MIRVANRSSSFVEEQNHHHSELIKLEMTESTYLAYENSKMNSSREKRSSSNNYERKHLPKNDAYEIEYRPEDRENNQNCGGSLMSTRRSGNAKINRSINRESGSPPKMKSSNQKQYLYEKLAGTEKNIREETNHIYDRRIKTYTELIWKLQFAHNIYI